MTPEAQTPRPRRKHLFAWLSRANAELSGWAAATSWWRLIVLFLVVLIAGNLIADQLHLKHQRVVIARGNDSGVEVTRVGPDGIRITRRRDPAANAPGQDGEDAADKAVPGAESPEVPVPPRPPGVQDRGGSGDDDDDEPRT